MEDKVVFCHRNHSANVLGLTLEGGTQRYLHKTLTLPLKITRST
jgi:hypothetical protein